MSWAAKRKLFYIFLVLVFLTIMSLGFYFKYFTKNPTCFDGVQNGGEKGIDCGGICQVYCPNQLGTPKLRWQLPFKITDTVTTVGAYIENIFPGAGAQSVDYKFDVYDDNNDLITTKIGNTFIGNIGKTVIVEPLVQTEGKKPAFVLFSYTKIIPWEKIDSKYTNIVIKTDRYTVEKYSTGITTVGTRLVSYLDNKSAFNFSNLEVGVILRDNDDNVITITKGVIPTLGAGQTSTLYVTWPFEIKQTIARVEIIPRINPFVLHD